MKYLLVLLFVFNTAFAESCEREGEEICVEGKETREIDGFEVTKDCWKYRRQEKCSLDNCVGIKKTPGCSLVSSDCIESGSDGVCNVYSNKYKCGGFLKETEGTVFLESEYTITKDEDDLKECEQFALDKECHLSEKKCVEGEETRIINGHKVHKECWKYERKYICITGSKVSECDEYKNRCALKSTRCLSKNKETNQCNHTEKVYECLKLEGSVQNTMKCSGVEYCISGDCEKVELKQNKNMGSAIAALNVLAGLKGDSFELGDVAVFKGECNKCSKKFLPGITKNCCTKGKTFLERIKLFGCGNEEELLADKRDNGLCHYIGSYCSQKVWTPFGKICLTKKESYCCFKSKIARLIQVQGKAQLGISFGTPENPNCRSLTLEELQKIDFSKIDFSELQIDIQKRMLTNFAKAENMPKDGQKKAEQLAASNKDKIDQMKSNPNKIAQNAVRYK